MAKGIELTLDEVKKHPESFMYVFVSDAFLDAIQKKYASIIRVKRANQRKVLMLSADKYLGSFEKVDQYYAAIREAFIEIYGMTPAEALVTLAKGGSVAGKNWSDGVFGIGALHSNTFAGVSAGDGGSVTVDSTTGHIFYNGKDITDESRTEYGDVKGKTMPVSFCGIDDFGYVYQSKWNKTYKKYYAYMWTNDDGNKFTAAGKSVTSDMGESIWGNITFDWSFFQNVLNWILSLFGLPTLDVDGSTPTKQLSAENTLPNQTADGFVQEAGMVDAAGLLLMLAAGGALVATGGLEIKKGMR